MTPLERVGLALSPAVRATHGCGCDRTWHNSTITGPTAGSRRLPMFPTRTTSSWRHGAREMNTTPTAGAAGAVAAVVGEVVAGEDSPDQGVASRGPGRESRASGRTPGPNRLGHVPPPRPVRRPPSEAIEVTKEFTAVWPLPPTPAGLLPLFGWRG